MSARSRHWTALVTTLLAAAFAPSCGVDSGGTDSNTHWLDGCTTEADCGGLACVCGLCTASCDDDGACSRFGQAARCSEPSTASCGEATPGPVCLRACASGLDCPGSLVCSAGRCQPPRRGRDAGAGGDGSGGATAGDGGASGGADAGAASGGAAQDGGGARDSGPPSDAGGIDGPAASATDAAGDGAVPPPAADSGARDGGDATADASASTGVDASSDGGADAGPTTPSGDASPSGTDGSTPGDASDGAAGKCANLGQLTEYPMPHAPGGRAYPNDLVEGPDGNVWVSVMGGSVDGKDSLVRITPDGLLTTFPAPYPGSLAVGSDGNLWLATSDRISRVTLAGDVTTFTVPGGTGWGGIDIVSGPDGALWFTETDDNQIGRITTDGVVTEYTLPFPVQTMPDDPKVQGPYGITVGPDGALWFTENYTSKVGRITTDGTITEYPLAPFFASRRPTSIVARDGALWVVENYSADLLTKVTVEGAVTAAFGGPMDVSVELVASGLAFGTDGDAWIGGFGNSIARITPAGEAASCSLALCCDPARPYSVERTSAGDIWFIEYLAGVVGRIVPRPH